MPSINKVYRLEVSLLGEKYPIVWKDIDLEEARVFLDQIKTGQDLENDNLFINAKYVIHAEISSRERPENDRDY